MKVAKIVSTNGKKEQRHMESLTEYVQNAIGMKERLFIINPTHKTEQGG